MPLRRHTSSYFSQATHGELSRKLLLEKKGEDGEEEWVGKSTQKKRRMECSTDSSNIYAPIQVAVAQQLVSRMRWMGGVAYAHVSVWKDSPVPARSLWKKRRANRYRAYIVISLGSYIVVLHLTCTSALWAAWTASRAPASRADGNEFIQRPTVPAASHDRSFLTGEKRGNFSHRNDYMKLQICGRQVKWMAKRVNRMDWGRCCNLVCPVGV